MSDKLKKSDNPYTQDHLREIHIAKRHLDKALAIIEALERCEGDCENERAYHDDYRRKLNLFEAEFFPAVQE